MNPYKSLSLSPHADVEPVSKDSRETRAIADAAYAEAV
jgi:hypothetical protein